MAIAGPVTSLAALYTPAMLQQALQAATSRTQPQLDALNQQIRALLTGQAQQNNAVTGATNAAVKELQQIPGQIGDTFTGAAQRQAEYGKGFSTLLQGIAQNAADQSNRTLNTVSPGIGARVDSHARDLANVLYGLGGYNPSSVLNTAGAAFQSAAQMLPGQAYAQAAALKGKIAGETAKAESPLAAQIAKLRGSIPGLAQQIATGYGNQQIKLDANQLTAQAKDALLALNKGKATDAQINQAGGAVLPDGTVVPKPGNTYDPATGAFKKIPKPTPSVSIATPYGKIAAPQAQINEAVKKIQAVAATHALVTISKPVLDAAGVATGKTQKATVKPNRGSNEYYQAIHEAEAMAAPLLNLQIGDPRLIQFVQAQVNPHFSGKQPKRAAAKLAAPGRPPVLNVGGYRLVPGR